MKKLILTSATILSFVFGAFAQDNELSYELRGKYSRPLKKEQLAGVSFVHDMIVAYPANWISSYVSVEIEATCNGKSQKAMGKNDALSPEQKNILSRTDLGSDVVIKVKYIYNDPVTHAIENNVMRVSFTIVPEIEAGYQGGRAQLTKYLKTKGIQNMPGSSFNPNLIGPRLLPQYTAVRFTINPAGQVEQARIFHASLDPKRDLLLLDAIRQMPKWKPAENSKGEKVKQDFELLLGNGFGDGC